MTVSFAPGALEIEELEQEFELDLECDATACTGLAVWLARCPKCETRIFWCDPHKRAWDKRSRDLAPPRVIVCRFCSQRVAHIVVVPI